MERSEVATVYIISKGRPECKTARTLERIGFPGEWFIVCGTNDETLDEYIRRWGIERVKVFDFDEAIAHTDTMDNFGFEEMASGACPVRNAVREISAARGERRHWQLDDDYTGFQVYRPDGTRPRCTGEELYRWMVRLGEFADRCGLANCGFPPSTIETDGDSALTVGKRVFNAHNLPSDAEAFEEWRGRMNDDLINAINVWRHGKIELTVKFLAMNMPPTQSERGGAYGAV